MPAWFIFVANVLIVPGALDAKNCLAMPIFSILVGIIR